eukprot:1153277-Pelagomonas_calceolata.AAC.11
MQLSNALFRSRNGAGGAEMGKKAVYGFFLPRKGWASQGDDLLELNSNSSCFLSLPLLTWGGSSLELRKPLIPVDAC